MTKTITLAATIAAVALAGCGGASSGNGPVPPPKQHYTEVQMLATIGNVPNCSVVVWLTTPAEVALYANAGDPVASNPTRTAGVKFEPVGSASTSECYQRLTQGLSKLK